MRLMKLALVVAGGAVLASTAMAPALAEEVYVRGPGIGIELGTHPHRHRDVTVERRVYTDGHSRERCRTVIIKSEGVTKKIRRCRD